MNNSLILVLLGYFSKAQRVSICFGFPCEGQGAFAEITCVKEVACRVSRSIIHHPELFP